MESSPVEQRRLAKLAALIHDRLLQDRETDSNWHLPDYTWRNVQREHHRLRLATGKGWRHTQAVQYERLRNQLQVLERELMDAVHRFQAPIASVIASPRDIFNDLVALHDEFDTVSHEARAGLLCVTTDPITLEGIYLGPFRIEVDLRKLIPNPNYLVIAEEPVRPDRNSEVTHPHVKGDRLCEGEGTMMLRAAIRSGRVLDYFLMVNNLLHTYNSASPYVAISEWNGTSCNECDYSMDSDDARLCERCEVTLCSECTRCCCDCSDIICSPCSLSCNGCDDDACRGCAKTCCDCHETFCSSCLQDDERCQNCHEEFSEQAANRVAHAPL